MAILILILIVNVTAGPGIFNEIYNGVNSTCDGNVYNITRACCAQLGGIANSSSLVCETTCCQMSPGGLNGTCPNGEFKYPICILPTHMNFSDWDRCYAPLVQELEDSRNGYYINPTWGCNPPKASVGVRYAAPVALGLLAAVAASVVSM